ncbi:hypothetical protein KCP71_16500 [Salmonella enterica subsp. enterica]|nr:hypothetical protein KCP71_16500 [Salmonella enterica subsp. enterica]
MNTFTTNAVVQSGQGSPAGACRFTNKHIWRTAMAFRRALRCWILRNAPPADNRISVFSEITPDPHHPCTVVQGHCANAVSCSRRW